MDQKLGEVAALTSKEILVEVEQVKAYLTRKDKKDGNEKADELAKARAMLDEGLMAQTRARTVQQEEEVYAALQYAASFHFLVEEWKDCEELKLQSKEVDFRGREKGEVMKHQTEWCAAVSKYRRLRCGRGSKYI